MINSTEELDMLIGQRLVEKFNPGYTGTNTYDAPVPVVYGVPEEEVLNQRLLPAVSIGYLWEELYNPNRLMGVYYKEIGEGENVRWEERPMPEPIKYFYQIDLYSQTQEKMVELSTELFRSFRRRGSFLTDKDGNAVDVEMTDSKDFSRDIHNLGKTEERLFHRAYTFSFACLYEPAEEPSATYGPVLDTDISLREWRANRSVEELRAEVKGEA